MIRSNLTKAAAVAGVALSLAAIDVRSAEAVVISPLPTFNGTGIDNLDIEGTIYNVTFGSRSYSSVFSSSAPTFLGNPGGASVAALAVRNFCFTSSACGSMVDDVLVPFNISGGDVFSRRRTIFTNASYPQFSVDRAASPSMATGSDAFYATFALVETPTESVPEPLTILGSAAAVGFGAAMKRVADKKKSAC